MGKYPGQVVAAVVVEGFCRACTATCCSYTLADCVFPQPSSFVVTLSPTQYRLSASLTLDTLLLHYISSHTITFGFE